MSKDTVFECPHCGKKIVDGDYVLVPIDSYYKMTGRVAYSHTVDSSRKKLGFMVDRLIAEVAKVHDALGNVKDGIIQAGSVLDHRWEDEWPYKDGKECPTMKDELGKRYALPLSVYTVKDNDGKVIQAVVSDAQGNVIGPTFETAEEAKELAERVEKNGGLL